MKTVFITRTKSKKEFKNLDLIKLIKAVSDSSIKIVYILSDFNDNDYKEFNVKSTKIIVIKDENPTGPTSINIALQRVKEDKINPVAFLVCSQEIDLEAKNIAKLIEKIKTKKDLLVVGYKFKIENKKLNNELMDYYANKSLIAYKVPWNTCAMWNYKLFDEYVSKFDEITAKNPFNQIGVSIDGICSLTPHEGMEDGLAIAQATSNKQRQLYFKLLDEYLSWTIITPKKHREKLARKDTVMRNFIAIRNYSVRDLEEAKMTK
jgi:hypothetical protein